MVHCDEITDQEAIMANEPKTLPVDYYGNPPAASHGLIANSKDVESTKAIIDAMYESVSGKAGQPRDWNRLRSLCIDEAYSIRTGKLEDGRVACKVMRTEEYIEQTESWLLSKGFYEIEVHRVEERFGNIVHVFSTYESRRSPDDPKPFMRGINSIQLLFDGKRWWVMNVMWQHESDEYQLPAKYLP
jgi:hypothetical protein